jgi:hypothetical protein
MVQRRVLSSSTSCRVACLTERKASVIFLTRRSINRLISIYFAEDLNTRKRIRNFNEGDIAISYASQLNLSDISGPVVPLLLCHRLKDSQSLNRVSLFPIAGCQATVVKLLPFDASIKTIITRQAERTQQLPNPSSLSSQPPHGRFQSQHLPSRQIVR